MDGFYLAAFILVVSWGGVSHQMPQEATALQEPLGNSTSNAVTMSTTESTVMKGDEVKNCTTAKRVDGVCIERQYCDYSTSYIDLTLYAPRWYKKPCKVKEVCCPFNSLVRVEPITVALDEENAFQFDEDD